MKQKKKRNKEKKEKERKERKEGKEKIKILQPGKGHMKEEPPGKSQWWKASLLEQVPVPQRSRARLEHLGLFLHVACFSHFQLSGFKK